MKLRRRSLVVLMAPVIVATMTPLTGTAAASRSPKGYIRHHVDNALGDGPIRSLENLDATSFQALRRAVIVQPEVLLFPRSVHDLDGDGGRDVLVQRYDLVWDPTGVLFLPSGTMTVKLLSGRDGTELWTKSWAFMDGWAGIGTMQVGPEGVNGLLALITHNFSTALTLDLQALTGAGDLVWQRTFPSTWGLYTGWGLLIPGSVATDDVFALDRLDAEPGRATDILVGRASYARVWAAGARTTTTKISVIDGSDGSIRDEEPVMPAERIPALWAVPSIDGKGDDYIVATKTKGATWQVTARDGGGLGDIWSKKFELGWGPWMDAVRDLTGDGRGDLLVAYDRGSSHLFRVVDALTGEAGPEMKGYFPYVLGDADGDGRVDLGAFESYHSKGKAGHRMFGYATDGHRLYSELHARRPESCSRFCFSIAFLLDAGDVSGDGARDTFFDQYLMDGDGGGGRSRFTASGATGRRLLASKFVPLRGSVDGGGDDVAIVRHRRSFLEIDVRDAPSLTPLWSAVVRFTTTPRLSDAFQPYGSVTYLNSDGCGDLLLGVRGDDHDFAIVALDGSDGSLLWVHTAEGSGDVAVSRSGSGTDCST